MCAAVSAAMACRAVSVCFARVRAMQRQSPSRRDRLEPSNASTGWTRPLFGNGQAPKTRTNGMQSPTIGAPTGKKNQEGTRRKRPRPSAAEERPTRTDPRGDATTTSRRRIRRRRRRRDTANSNTTHERRPRQGAQYGGWRPLRDARVRSTDATAADEPPPQKKVKIHALNVAPKHLKSRMPILP